MKILAILFIAGLVYYILRELKQIKQDQAPGEKPAKNSQAEPVKACKLCGVHVPETEGVEYQQAFFCCEEHKTKYLENNSS